MSVQGYIEKMGVRVLEGECPGGWWGFYDDVSHTVVLRAGLAPLQRRSTLAHELGHAFYRHRGSVPPQEKAASVWAARILIRHRDFAALTRMYDSVKAVAHELNVLPRDVENYWDWWVDSSADKVSTSTHVDLLENNFTQLHYP